MLDLLREDDTGITVCLPVSARSNASSVSENRRHQQLAEAKIKG